MDRAASVKLRFEDYKNNSYLTHNFHPYPAKFVPQIPAELIDNLSEPGQWIGDPFVGSGTTLVEAKLAGRNACGSDINPLSCLVSRVKTTVLSDEEMLQARKLATEAAINVANEEEVSRPSFAGIERWFSPQAQRGLAALLAVIRRPDGSARVREFLEVAFSAIVVRASNQDSDTRYKIVVKNIDSFSIAEMFVARVNDMLHRMRQFRHMAKPLPCSVLREDATKQLSWVDGIHLAITSPPYMNSYDYYLYHKHRMNWLGLDYRAAQDAEFGSRNKHNDKKLGVDAYNASIRQNAELVIARLVSGGHYCIVVGDAILRGELVKMNANFDNVMSGVGFHKVREITFPQRKYTRSFTPGMREEFKNSYVLIYRKA